ncbi:hypothetical protein BS47DRAFT_1386508, partial [Hydnum rufescens UP504]
MVLVARSDQVPIRTRDETTMLRPSALFEARCRLLRLRTSEPNRGPLNERSLLGRKAWSLNPEDSSCNRHYYRNSRLPYRLFRNEVCLDVQLWRSYSCGSVSATGAIPIPVPKPLISTPPTRRAFSGVMSHPSPMSAGLDDDDDDECSSDFEVDTNSPAHRAQAARRENVDRMRNPTRPHSRIDP